MIDFNKKSDFLMALMSFDKGMSVKYHGKYTYEKVDSGIKINKMMVYKNNKRIPILTYIGNDFVIEGKTESFSIVLFETMMREIADFLELEEKDVNDNIVTIVNNTNEGWLSIYSKEYGIQQLNGETTFNSLDKENLDRVFDKIVVSSVSPQEFYYKDTYEIMWSEVEKVTKGENVWFMNEVKEVKGQIITLGTLSYDTDLDRLNKLSESTKKNTRVERAYIFHKKLIDSKKYLNPTELFDMKVSTIENRGQIKELGFVWGYDWESNEFIVKDEDEDLISVSYSRDLRFDKF